MIHPAGRTPLCGSYGSAGRCLGGDGRLHTGTQDKVTERCRSLLKKWFASAPPTGLTSPGGGGPGRCRPNFAHEQCALRFVCRTAQWTSNESRTGGESSSGEVSSSIWTQRAGGPKN